jgi:hypothetical protein
MGKRRANLQRHPARARAIGTLLSVIDDLERQIAPIERELRLARPRQRAGATADDDPQRYVSIHSLDALLKEQKEEKTREETRELAAA